MPPGTSTEEMEADREWQRGPAHLRTSVRWEGKMAFCAILAAVSFGAGVALEDQGHDTIRSQEREAFARAVRACRGDQTTGTPVAREDGWVECHALAPRLQNMDRALTPSAAELKTYLLRAMKGDMR